MNIENMKEVFEIAHKSKRSVKMVGPHGIGKSQIVSAFGKENGYHVEILQLPLMDEGDLMGIPVTETRDGETVTVWAKPVWLQRIHTATAQGIPTILFLDELGRASVGIRQVALQLVLENRLQEFSLGEVNGLPTLKVVADNPSDEYDTADFDPALESRFMSFNVEPNIESFLKYGRSAGMLPVVTDYLAEFAEKLHFQPESDDDKGSNPRSWEFLSDTLKNTPKGSPLLYSLIVSEIGATVGASFHHFFNNYINVVKPEDIMKIIGKSKLDTEEAQRKVAKKLSKTTRDIEVISIQELAEKMLVEVNAGNISDEAMIAFLGSLNLEVAAGILKTWKTSDVKEQEAWYMDSYPEAQPNKWLAHDLIASVAI